MAVPVPLHRISVHFNKLDKIEEFLDDIIAEKHGFPSPDIAQIKAKKNFNYISKLTYGISIILLFFSIFSIISYLSNLLKSHLEKIKPTIGTFMAFGTPGLGKIFLVLMTVFIVFPMILSLIIASILGNIGFILGLMKFMIPSLENYTHVGLIYGIMKLMIPSLEKFTYFDLFAYGDSWILTSSGIFLILLLSYWMFRRTINLIFRETPGNLIFGRA